MLVVQPVEAGRTWGLQPADHSMFDNARTSSPASVAQVWVRPVSPAFVADRQVVSPMAQNLLAPRGSLARRRPAHPPRRRRVGSNGRGGGWRVAGGTVAENRPSEGGSRRGYEGAGDCGTTSSGGGVGDSHRGGKGGSGVSSENFPRSHDQSLREEAGRTSRFHGDRAAGSTGGGAAISARGGSDEAWSATSVVVAGTTERMISGSGGGGGGGAASNRGGKSTMGTEVWAWAGSSGGAARGKAMLSAYGIQTDRHNPTCPRGTPADGRTKHNRWSRGQSLGTKQGPVVINIDDGQERCTGESGHGERFRGTKGRKSRPAASTDNTNTCYRASAEGCLVSDTSAKARGVRSREEGSGGRVGQSSSGLGQCVNEGGATMATGASPRSSERLDYREQADDHRSPADQIRQALEDLLVPPRSAASPAVGSTPLKHQNTNPSTVVDASEHRALLSMDGRGGSAAPPHRPHQLTLRPTAGACASYAPRLPGIVAVSTGLGMVATCDADGSGGSVTADSSTGGDDRSTPPMSRQRAHSRHSPWHSREYPRAFSGGDRGGADSGRSHIHHHQHRSSGGEHSAGLSVRPSSHSSSEVTGDIGHVTRMLDGNDYGTNPTRPSAAPPIGASSTRATSTGAGGQHDDQRGSSTDTPTHWAVASVDGEVGPSTTAAASTATQEPVPGLGSTSKTTARDSSGGLDPFGRLPPGSASITPQSELIDHFKVVPRPTSRRGTRKQGAEGEEAQPAFCLFSRQRGDGGGGVGGTGWGGDDSDGRGGSGGGRRSRSKEETERQQRQE